MCLPETFDKKEGCHLGLPLQNRIIHGRDDEPIQMGNGS